MQGAACFLVLCPHRGDAGFRLLESESVALHQSFELGFAVDHHAPDLVVLLLAADFEQKRNLNSDHIALARGNGFVSRFLDGWMNNRLEVNLGLRVVEHDGAELLAVDWTAGSVDDIGAEARDDLVVSLVRRFEKLMSQHVGVDHLDAQLFKLFAYR